MAIGKRPKIGDIFEVAATGGFGYGQYILKYTEPPCWGSFVRVFRGVRAKRPTDWNRLCDEEEQFLVFYPIGSAARSNAVTIVGHGPVPERLKSFPRFKTYGAHEQKPHGRIKSWLFGSGPDVTCIKDEDLTDEQRRMPLCQIITHEVLVDRIESGWTHACNYIDL